jgi:hypothetical protein
MSFKNAKNSLAPDYFQKFETFKISIRSMNQNILKNNKIKSLLERI